MEGNGLFKQITAIFFLLLPALFAIAVVGLFGGAFSKFYPQISYWQGFWMMNLICGSGWVLFMLILFLFMENSVFTDYLSYLIPAVLFSGLAVLIPYIVWDLAGGTPLPAFAWATVAISVAIMVLRNYRKIRFLNLPVKWWFTWLACLLVPAILCIYFLVPV